MTAAERVEQAQREIARHRRFLDEAGTPKDNASQIVRDQIQARLSELEEEIRRVGEPQLDVILAGESADQHRIPSDLLARILRRLQLGITRIGWAFHAGAGDDREPPVQIQRLTTFDVVALAPGSFRLSLRRPMTEDLMAGRLELATPELADTSVSALLTLLQGAATRSLGEDMEDLAHNMGRASAKSIQGLTSDLAQSGMTATFDWEGGGPQQRVQVTPDDATYLADWLRSVDQRTREITVRGTLHGGDDLVGRFKLVDAADSVYEGKADPDVLAGKTFGNTYVAVIDEVISITENIGTTTQRYILRGLRDPE